VASCLSRLLSAKRVAVREKGDSVVLPERCETDSVLSETYRVQQEAAHLGFDWNTVAGPLDKLREETDELARAVADRDHQRVEMELGDILFSAVNVARHVSVDPESALEKATRRFKERFAHVQATLARRGTDIQSSSLEQMNQVWDEIKRSE